MSDASTVVGRVARLGRYPVKSLQGENLDRAELSTLGIPGDRALGVVDVDTGRVLSAKSVPQLLDAEARTTGSGVEVRVPGDSWQEAPSPALDEAMSAWLGHAVRVEPPPPVDEDARSFTLSMNMDDQSADRFDWPCPSGTFFDLAAVHVLTTASIRAAQRLYPAGAWQVDRFRPTVLVDAAGDGFVDDAWVGGRLRFGTVEISVDLPTMRCIMTTRPQRGLARDLGIVKTVNQHHDGNLGLYCSMVSPGQVAVGDEVRFLPVS